MSVDILSEAIVSLAEAAKIIPTRPDVSTLWRWYRRGVRGIRLETVIIGGKRYTSRESIQRFIERTTEAHDKGAAAPAKPFARTRRNRNAAVTEAKKKLQAPGI
jgi:hypothetical protein